MSTNLSTCNIEELYKKKTNLLYHINLIEIEIEKKKIDDPMIIDSFKNRQIENILPVASTNIPTNTSLNEISIAKIKITPKKKNNLGTIKEIKDTLFKHNIQFKSNLNKEELCEIIRTNRLVKKIEKIEKK
jgi:hypothetical protein